MYKNQKRKKPPEETIFEMEARLKKQAREIAENFKHTKPVKYLLK